MNLFRSVAGIVIRFMAVQALTGIGLVHGQEVLFVANDATVKGGIKNLGLIQNNCW